VNHTEELGKMRVNITSFSESLDSNFRPAPRHGQPGPGACQWAGIGQCRTTSLEQGQLNQRTRIFTVYQPGMRAVTLAGLIKGAYQTPLSISAGRACLYRSVVGRQHRPTGLHWTGNTGQLVCIGQEIHCDRPTGLYWTGNTCQLVCIVKSNHTGLYRAGDTDQGPHAVWPAPSEMVCTRTACIDV
jgi:hypothetical protein